MLSRLISRPRPSPAAWSGPRSTAAAGDVCWLEHNFDAGRSYVMHAAPGDVAAAGDPGVVDVGTLAWEYGGGSYLVDRRRRRGLQRPRRSAALPGSARRVADAAHAVTTHSRAVIASPTGRPLPDGRWAAYVRESHRPGEPVRHALVAVDLDGSSAPRVLAAGAGLLRRAADQPRRRRLAWISWSKPRMPWDGTELWLADIRADLSLAQPRRIAGGPTESVLDAAVVPAGHAALGVRPLGLVEPVSHWVTRAARRCVPTVAEYRRPALAVRPPRLRLSRRRVDRRRCASATPCTSWSGSHRRPGRAQPLHRRLTVVADGHLSCHGDSVALAGATPTAGPAVLLGRRARRPGHDDRRGRAIVGAECRLRRERRCG